MFAPLFFALALAISSLAMPAALTARQNFCDGLAGATNSVPYNFTLNSVYSSGIGFKLALFPSPGYNWWLMQIYTNYTGDFSAWKLQDGQLLPIPSSDNVGLVGSDFAVPSQSIAEFAVTNNGSGNANAGRAPYCALSDAEGNAVLALNGNTQGFSLCQTPDLEWVLVYEAGPDNNGTYSYSSCATQTVQLVKA